MYRGSKCLLERVNGVDAILLYISTNAVLAGDPVTRHNARVAVGSSSMLDIEFEAVEVCLADASACFEVVEILSVFLENGVTGCESGERKKRSEQHCVQEQRKNCI